MDKVISNQIEIMNNIQEKMFEIPTQEKMLEHFGKTMEYTFGFQIQIMRLWFHI